MKDINGIQWYTDVREIKNIKQLLNESCELYADRPAFWIKKFKGDEYHPITYNMLKHDVEAIGTKMLDMGLSGRRIAVMGQGCYEWFVTYLAVVNGVGVVVPVDKELEADAVENILKTAECSVLFYTSSESKKIDKIPGLDIKVKMEFYGDRISSDEPFIYQEEEGLLCWRQMLKEGYELVEKGVTDYMQREIDDDAMSVLLFTSGTTGSPKGVMLSHANIAANVMQISWMEEIRPDDLTLSVLPIHHTYESTGTLLFLFRGASIAYSEGLKHISKNMLEVHNTFFIAVPLLLETVYKRIWKQAKKQGKDKILKKAIAANNKVRSIGINVGKVLFKSIQSQLGGRLRMVVSGASAISPEIVRGFDDLGIRIVTGYGLTETAPMITATPSFSDKLYKKAGSVGICVKTGELKINDPDEYGIGEVWYKGPNVMLGYYNMPELTSETIQDGWFKTGDLGFIDNEGWLYLTGRKKNVIVTKTGENVYPEEIEEIIRQNPYINDCMVYPLSRNNEEIVAVQVLPDEEEIKEAFGEMMAEDELYKFMKDIISDINGTLPNYKMMRDVIVRKDDFVRTTTKKIKRQDNI